MNYVENLEKCFHVDFINMESNVIMKKYNIVGYVKMLESITKVTKHIILISKKNKRIDIKTPHIFAYDSDGNLNKWIIEEELKTYFKISCYGAVTAVAKNKINNTICDYQINLPKGCNRNTLSYLIESGNIDATK